MKFNWGTGIAVFYGAFVLALVGAVIKSTTYDNSLVSDDYYAEDLQYQQNYDKLANSQALAQDLQIEQDANMITLQFPQEVGAVAGTVTFFCPSASEQDFTIDIRTDAQKTQVIELSESLKTGLWRIKVDWQSDGKPYYKEESIVLKNV